MNVVMTLDPWIISEKDNADYQNDKKSKQSLGVF